MCFFKRFFGIQNDYLFWIGGSLSRFSFVDLASVMQYL